MADACIFLMEKYNDGEIVNIGTGQDLTIKELAELIANETGCKGAFEFDVSKPNGTPRKLLDVGRINKLGWRAQISLRTGVIEAIMSHGGKEGSMIKRKWQKREWM